jgi:predicted DNA-binding WGR domain protein
MAQAKLYTRLGEIDNAAKATRDGFALYEGKEIAGKPTPLVRDRELYWSLYDLFCEAKRYEDAQSAAPLAEKTTRQYAEAIPMPEDQRALMLIQVLPGWDAALYEKWGKYTTARRKHEEMIRFLNSPETQKNILSKLKEKHRKGWEFNRDFVYPLKVAQMHIKEGTIEDAKKVLAILKQKLQDPSFEKKHTTEPLDKEWFEFWKKQAEEAMRACGMQ